MSAATVSLPDMGEWNITSQIKIDGQVAPDFSFDWEVVFQGHKYIMPLRKPQGSKENTTLSSVIDLTFQHWAQYQLKRWYFFNIQSTEAGVAWKKYIAPVSLNLGDFCGLFAQVLEFYYGDKITLALNPAWQYKAEPEMIDISYSHIWNVLIKLYEVYGVRWVIEPNGSPEKYVIKVGYPTTEQSHIFEYGFEGGLLKVERQVQSEEIANMILGCGGEKNLPYRYFKNIDPENPSFPADPDWIEELANVYFSNLMPATFRSYVQGWKAAHISKYPGYTAVGEANAYAPWAYRKGFTDEKFDPVEYVADEITINPETGDKIVVISPTYSPYVKKGSSISKYGALLNGLDNNDEIYPTIQGVTVDPYGRIDEAVEVEPITSDDIEEAAESDAQVSDVGGCRGTATNVAKSSYKRFTIQGATFTVPSGKRANLDVSPRILSVTSGDRHDKVNAEVSAEITDYAVKVYGADGEVSASGLSGGAYRYEVTVEVHNMTTDKSLNITVGDESPTLTTATVSEKWSNVWRIWVKNLWQTSKQSGETDAQYAERVWRPILGDREGNEAKVVFASGMLAHEDYEFTITSIPKYERKLCKWQTIENGKVVEHEYYSEWCITLGKSDADLETLGVYLPSTMRQAVAGDFFFFIGIDMPHLYTVWAEERVDEWKKDYLAKKKDIKPTWVVQTDRVRLNGEGREDALIRQLHPGDTLRLADKRFIEGVYETLYLSSLTITYREPTSDDAALNPDVEIVLSDRYETAANPVATLQGEVSALAKQVGSISNVEQIVRAVGDKLYLRKDGMPDRSYSPTEFASLLTSLGFRSGMVGGAGWGAYKDANGNWVIEADRLIARQDLTVNNLVINQVTGQGGTIVESAARMEITKVVERTDGYACYFDQKEGTVANLFHVDDVAWNNRFTPENNSLKFYKRRVIEVGEDYVVLSKTEINGTGIPAEGDVIVQYGNYTDKRRQYVKVRDVVGGGYERYIEGLNSVNAEGVEYYFVGRQDGQNPRWFIGNRDLVPYSGDGDGSYVEYKDRKFNFNNVGLSITSTIGGLTFEEYIKQVSPPVEREDIEGFVEAITNPRFTEIQNQIDGVIETWFYNGAPTLTNYPASEWNTDNLKIQHLGDLYYDNDTGTAYRFSQNAQGGYYWNTITDDAITKALATAQKAQDTADGKRRIFTSQPTPPYQQGDLWVNATYGAQYKNDILRCGTAKGEGSTFDISDWGLASNYTDDTLAQSAMEKITGFEYLKNALAQDTEIQGGLIMSTLISLGYKDESGRHTLAGINGSWVESLGGRTIGSWWGGNMVDLFDRDGNKITPAPADAATSLVRMDGSAYWAKGNIGFNADGSGWLGNYENGIQFGSDGTLVLGSGLTIALNGTQAGLAATLETVLNLSLGVATLLVPVDAAGNELPWSQASKAVTLKAKANLLATGEMTAYGSADFETFGGARRLDDLTDVSLGAIAVGDVLSWDGSKWVNKPVSVSGGTQVLDHLLPVGTLSSANIDTLADTKMTLWFVRNETTDRPTTNGYILNFDWDSLNHWGSQLFISHSTGNMHWRPQNGTAWSTQAWRTLLDTSNYAEVLDGRYVNASGDTMTGRLTVSNSGWADQLAINNTSSGGDMYLRLYNPDGNHYLGVSGATKDLAFNHNGSTYKIWHSGNDGAGSGLDADLLDGLHASGFMRSAYGGGINFNDMTVSGVYRYDTGTTNGPGDEWGQLLVLKGAGDTVAQMAFCFNDSGLIRVRSGNPLASSGSWGAWRQLARTTDNVASATKLQNTRTLWGQSFDGTGNVDGTIAVNHPDYHAINLRRTTSGAYGCSIGFTTGEGTYVGDVGFDGNKYFNVRNASGTTLIAALQNGNVGFGTTTPRYKADIVGDVIADGWLRTTGQRGWYNETYGGGLYMTEGTTVKVFNGKHFECAGTIALSQNNGTGYGISLYGGPSHVQGYGLMFALTSNFGKHGGVQGDWATYFTMDGATNRGWCFRHKTGGVVASISAAGYVLANGDFTAFSDRRMKSDIRTIKGGKRLRPVTYIKDGSRHAGLIAQEVEPLCPEVVTVGDDPIGLLALNYSGALCYALAGVYNELDAHARHINELMFKIQDLERDNESMRQYIKRIERRLVA